MFNCIIVINNNLLLLYSLNYFDLLVINND